MEHRGLRSLVCAAGVAVLTTVASATAVGAGNAPSLVSGTYAVTTTSPYGVFPSTWKLTVNGGSIGGVSIWSCCPANRRDPMTGSVAAGKIRIVRDCSGQGADECTQTYIGTIGANGTVSGAWSGTSGPGNWSTQVPAGKPKRASTTTEEKPKPKPKPKTVVGLPLLPQLDDASATARILSLQKLNRSGAAAVLVVTRDGKQYAASEDARLKPGDKLTTRSNTVTAFEFLDGGRVGMNQDTTIEVGTDRTTNDVSHEKRDTVLSAGKMWVHAGGVPKTGPAEPLEIQTNGGTTGIRG